MMYRRIGGEKDAQISVFARVTLLVALQSSNNSYLLCSFLQFKVSVCDHILLVYPISFFFLVQCLCARWSSNSY